VGLFAAYPPPSQRTAVEHRCCEHPILSMMLLLSSRGAYKGSPIIQNHLMTTFSPVQPGHARSGTLSWPLPGGVGGRCICVALRAGPSPRRGDSAPMTTAPLPLQPPYTSVCGGSGEGPGSRGFSRALRAGLRPGASAGAAARTHALGFTMVLPALRLRPRLCECRHSL
jgi:hypothetical protein